jgi:pyruvate dehydrogenase E2 component (dihydrolipoamide acetyltransferase)
MSRPDTPSDPERQTLELPEGPVRYTDVGQGRCFLALHGLPGSARDWRWLGPHLERDTRFVRLELPGFGETPIDTDPATELEARARFVIRVIESLGLDEVCLLGHSQGGGVALAVAALAPARVTGLGLISSIGLSPHKQYRQLGPAPRLLPLFDAPVVGRLLMPILRSLFRRVGFRGFSDEAILQTMRCVRALDFATIRRFVAQVRIPTLLAWAEDDPIVEPASGEALARALPDGPRLALPSGGHAPFKRFADEIGAALLRLGQPGS